MMLHGGIDSLHGLLDAPEGRLGLQCFQVGFQFFPFWVRFYVYVSLHSCFHFFLDCIEFGTQFKFEFGCWFLVFVVTLFALFTFLYFDVHYFLFDFPQKRLVCEKTRSERGCEASFDEGLTIAHNFSIIFVLATEGRAVLSGFRSKCFADSWAQI